MGFKGIDNKTREKDSYHKRLMRYNPVRRLMQRLARENLPTSTEPRTSLKWCGTCSRYHKGSAANGNCPLITTVKRTPAGNPRYVLVHPQNNVKISRVGNMLENRLMPDGTIHTRERGKLRRISGLFKNR